MLDMKFVRENPDIVKENIKKKFQDYKLPLVNEVLMADKELRQTQQHADDLRANRKKISKEIGKLMGQGKKEEAEEGRLGLKACHPGSRAAAVWNGPPAVCAEAAPPASARRRASGGRLERGARGKSARLAPRSDQVAFLVDGGFVLVRSGE